LYWAWLQLQESSSSSRDYAPSHQSWPAVHRLYAAHLFCLALDKGAGARYHGVAEEGVPVRDIAEVIGRRLNVPVVAKSPEEAAGHFGWLGFFVGVDCPASSAQTQQRLGWRPTQTGLISDLAHLET
jgi:nucleoside-diphosphate-sugar epimerase